MHSLRSVSPMRLAYAVGVVGLLLSSTVAHAVSITNRDDHDHKVTIIEGDTKTDHVLKPSQVLTASVPKGAPFVSTTTRRTSTSSPPMTSSP